ncbi:hypothetical protein Tco_0280484 [Tanacetum coccineum]
MEELLRIPIVGIENAIVVLAILADEFELKTELLDFVSNNSFFGLENDDPHSHIRRFYQITRTLRLNQVPDDVVKLILFPFSLKGAAETWLENEPPNSITSWDDLVSNGIPRPISGFVVESLSPLPIPYEDSDSLVEETGILLSHFDYSSPEYETFSFDIEEKELELVACTNTHSEFSLLDMIRLSLTSIDQFLQRRSDSYHEEFADELAHIISPPEYDLF